MRPVLLFLLAVCAALAIPSAASASPKLPSGADRPPALPPGVVPAEAPVETSSAQRPSAAGPLRAAGAAAAALDLDPWATVNICDTANLPNALGVRAGMPGTGRRQLMFMRFTAQYWSPSRNEWVDVPGNGQSRWVYAGSARYATQQTGWTFEFEQPPAGTTFVMRAVVEQEWRGPDPAADARRKGLKRTGPKRTDVDRGTRVHAWHRTGKRKRVMMQRFSQGSRRVTSRVARRGDPRARWAMAKERTLLTETGLTGVDGGDPPGTSKAMCLIW